MGIEKEPNIYEQPKKEESKIEEPKVEKVRIEDGSETEKKKEILTPQPEQKEEEQTPEEIRAVLEKALQEGSSIDLVILSLDGEPKQTPDLIVEEIEGDYLAMTYLDEKGETGEGIPLEISRVKKASLRESSIEK